MSFRPFTSESYAQDDRPEAWRDVLGAVGLQPASNSPFYDGHATASHRNATGLALTRISAGSQMVCPLPQSGDGLPIVLLPIEDGMVLREGSSHRIVPVGHLLLLPRGGDWSVVFQRDMRAIVLSVTSEALHGRIAGKSKLSAPRVVAPGGLADVFSRMLDATARTMETLVDVEWAAVAQSLVDLLLTFSHQLIGPASEASGTATQAALLHRICQTIERGLDDPELAPGACRAGGGNFRTLSAKAVRRCRRQFHPLCTRAPAAAGLGRSVQPCRSAQVDFGNCLSLRLWRFRAFQPDLSPSLRPAAARVSPAGSRTRDAAVDGLRPARLAAGRAGAVARASGLRRGQEDRSTDGPEGG